MALGNYLEETNFPCSRHRWKERGEKVTRIKLGLLESSSLGSVSRDFVCLVEGGEGPGKCCAPRGPYTVVGK